MPTEPTPLEGETLDGIRGGAIRIFQAKKGYRAGIDPVLLARFCTPHTGPALDLGTGSGIAALLLARDNPGLQVTGIELQPALAARARRAVELNGLQSQVQILEGDLRSLNLPKVGLVMCNPPYGELGAGRVSPNEERSRARHEVTATLEQIVEVGADALRPGGQLALVFPAAGRDRLDRALAQFGMSILSLREVSPRPGRAPELLLIRAVRGMARRAAPPPPLVLMEPEGWLWTEEAKSWLERGP